MAETCDRQEGVITRAELLALGVSRQAILRRLDAGRLFEQLPKVYSLSLSLSIRGHFMAAVLSCMPAVLSHRAAAAAWGLCTWPTGLIDVTVPTNREARKGVRIRRSKLNPNEMTNVDGFPVTSLARTLSDLAAETPPPRLADLIDKAERLGLFDLTGLEPYLVGKRGAKPLREIFADYTQPEPSRSELEQAFRRLCKDHDLPLPSLNTSVAGADVDAYWPGSDLVVELDSWRWHKTRRDFERDRAKAAKLEAAGIRVLRFTWRQLREGPGLIARAVRKRLSSADRYADL